MVNPSASLWTVALQDEHYLKMTCWPILKEEKAANKKEQRQGRKLTILFSKADCLMGKRQALQ